MANACLGGGGLCRCAWHARSVAARPSQGPFLVCGAVCMHAMRLGSIPHQARLAPWTWRWPSAAAAPPRSCPRPRDPRRRGPRPRTSWPAPPPCAWRSAGPAWQRLRPRTRTHARTLTCAQLQAGATSKASPPYTYTCPHRTSCCRIASCRSPLNTAPLPALIAAQAPVCVCIPPPGARPLLACRAGTVVHVRHQVLHQLVRRHKARLLPQARAGDRVHHHGDRQRGALQAVRGQQPLPLL